MTAPSDDTTHDDAVSISTHLEVIRRVLRDAAWAEARHYSISVTAPQVQALQAVVEHMRQTGTGISLSELSQRMGLAHSTTSGIVTRLENRNLLRRTTNPADRRFSLIELTRPAMDWVEHDLPASRITPLVAAVAQASPDERASIVNALALLERLLLQNATHNGRHNGAEPSSQSA